MNNDVIDGVTEEEDDYDKTEGKYDVSNSEMNLVFDIGAIVAKIHKIVIIFKVFPVKNDDNFQP